MRDFRRELMKGRYLIQQCKPVKFSNASRPNSAMQAGQVIPSSITPKNARYFSIKNDRVETIVFNTDAVNLHFLER